MFWRTPFKAKLREFTRSQKDDFIDAVSGAIDQLKKKRNGVIRAGPWALLATASLTSKLTLRQPCKQTVGNAC